jgi:hypothetical protein
METAINIGYVILKRVFVLMLLRWTLQFVSYVEVSDFKI